MTAWIKFYRKEIAEIIEECEYIQEYGEENEKEQAKIDAYERIKELANGGVEE